MLWAYGALTFILVVCTIVTMAMFKETIPKQKDLPPFDGKEFIRSLLSCFKFRDFTLVFCSRTCVYCGALTVMYNMQNYLKDVVQPATPNGRFELGAISTTSEVQATSIVMLAVFLGSLLGVMPAGWLSDRIGKRRVFVFGSCTTLALLSLIMVLRHDFAYLVVMGCCFGIAYGVFLSVDWAVGTEALPEPTSNAKDMAIWSAGLIVPMITAVPLGNVLRGLYRDTTVMGMSLGYLLMFSSCAVWLVVSPIFLVFTKNIR